MKTEFRFNGGITVILLPEGAKDEALLQMTFTGDKTVTVVNSKEFGGGIGLRVEESK